MDILFYSSLFVLWTMFWSFASVIIYRIKSWEWWILNGRSHCWKCNKLLKALDLIPIFPYLINKWKCNKCMNKISHIYPILEISAWVLFTLIWYFLIDSSLLFIWNTLEIYKLLFFLTIWFFSIIYIFYDILFLEIPEIIMSIWIWVILFVLSIQTIFSWINIISNMPSWVNNLNVWISAIILSLSIIVWLYIIMLKWLKEIYDVLILILIIFSLLIFKYIFDINLSDIAILNWLLWALSIFLFFFIQILISRWAWMWWGDLRIAILIWLILWTSLSFPWMMITYLVWSIIWLTMIACSKIKNLNNKKATKFESQVPFWPFLAIWFFITLFFQNRILELSLINISEHTKLQRNSYAHFWLKKKK